MKNPIGEIEEALTQTIWSNNTKVENVIYQPKIPDWEIAQKVKLVGKGPKGRSKQYTCIWDGRFKLISFPTTGTNQFIPWSKHMGKACPIKDAILALATFLCGGYPVPKKLEHEVTALGIKRIDCSLAQMVDFINKFGSPVRIGLETEILSDPDNEYPLGAEAVIESPPLERMRKSKITFRIQGSDPEKKAGETTGNFLEAVLFHANVIRVVEVMDAIKETINGQRLGFEQVNANFMELSNLFGQLQSEVEDNTAIVDQFGHSQQILDKTQDLLNDRLNDLDLLLSNLDFSDINAKLEVQNQETAEQTRLIGESERIKISVHNCFFKKLDNPPQNTRAKRFWRRNP